MKLLETIRELKVSQRSVRSTLQSNPVISRMLGAGKGAFTPIRDKGRNY